MKLSGRASELRQCCLPSPRLGAAAGRPGARKGSRKKPKLTVEDLASKPMGFAYLLTDLADDFRKVYKGPGHEVTDPNCLHSEVSAEKGCKVCHTAIHDHICHVMVRHPY